MNVTESSDKLLIVDGHNLLFQMFFGMPARIINKDGRAIHGVLGFTGALIKIIKMTTPTHVICLFDGEHENDRVELLTEYKANRIDYSQVSDDESPFSQLPEVYAALDFMGIRYAEADEYEADDAIASYAATYGHCMRIIISSFDSDFFQLINDNVSVLRYRGDNTVFCDTGYVKERYGVLPCQYADFKSLIGDSSDNIRGAEKIGNKTAASLLNQFGSLFEIINNMDKIAKPSIRESVIKNCERLLNNYKLIKLDNRAGLIFELNELRYSYDGISTNEVLKGIGLR